MDVALHFEWSRFSAVKIDYFPHQPELHNVTNDQCGIIRLAMQRVMAMGYRRIGFVMHRGWDHSVDHLWSAGFLCEQQNLAEGDRIPRFLFPAAEPVEAWINTVGTRRAWRGKGVASWLMTESLRRIAAADDGFERAILGVDAENPTGALSVYRRLGFAEDVRAVTSFTLTVG